MMFRLVCNTCGVWFKPFVCTEPLELLCPNYEWLEESNPAAADQLRRFHERHASHSLEEVEVDLADSKPSRDPVPISPAGVTQENTGRSN